MWSPTITFHNCLQLGIESCAEEIVKIAESASKEYTIEQTLDKMEADWDSNLMDLMPHKKTGKFQANKFTILFERASASTYFRGEIIVTLYFDLCLY